MDKSWTRMLANVATPAKSLWQERYGAGSTYKIRFPKHDKATVDSARLMYEKGIYTQVQIAAATGMSPVSVHYHKRVGGWVAHGKPWMPGRRRCGKIEAADARSVKARQWLAHGHSVNEIANRMGIHPSNVYKLLKRKLCQASMKRSEWIDSRAPGASCAVSVTGRT